jgi:NCS1 family nucleobase:cation symporter-1
VYLVMFVLLAWVLIRTGGAPGVEVSPARVHGGSAVLQFASIVGLIVAFFGTFLLNISDFSRSSPSQRSMRRANLWGLPVNFLVFAVTVAVVTTGSATLFGHAVTDPIELVQRIDNTPVLIFATIVFTIATIGVNVAANVVSPAFDFSNIAPRYITFERGGILAAIGSILVCPWALYSSPVVVDYFIGGLGALLGPLFGVIVTDFHLVRRGRVDVAALYVEGGGPYWYRRGVNPRAMLSAAVGAVLAIPVALLGVGRGHRRGGVSHTPARQCGRSDRHRTGARTCLNRRIRSEPPGRGATSSATVRRRPVWCGPAVPGWR